MIQLLPVWSRVAALALLCATSASMAAEPPTADANAQELDQSLQQLKEEAVDIRQKMLTAEDDLLYPPETRVDVYLGVPTPGLLISQITVSVDGGTPVHYDYGEIESIVLQKNGGLHRVMRANAAAGTHSIHADYVARWADAKLADLPVTGSFEGSFVKAADSAEIELVLSRQTYVAHPTLRLRQWSAAR